MDSFPFFVITFSIAKTTNALSPRVLPRALTQNPVNGRFSNSEDQNQEYLNNLQILECTGIGFSSGLHGFNNSGTQFIYRHKFANPGQQFSADLDYNAAKGDNY